MYERALFVHIYLCALKIVFARVCVAFMTKFACSGGSWMCIYVEECVVCACGV